MSNRTMKVQALTGNHDRNGFDCGVEAPNLWLRQFALQHQAKGSAGIFVDAKNTAAARFYADYGFMVCKEQLLKMYLPMW